MPYAKYKTLKIARMTHPQTAVSVLVMMIVMVDFAIMIVGIGRGMAVV
jgi:hypothetical protein